jgi:TolA-binding protein
LSNLWDKLDPEEREALAPLRRELEELARRHENDPPLDLLRAAKAGALPDAAQRFVAQHLEQSAWSRALASDLEDVAPDSSDRERILARVRASARAEAHAESGRNWYRFWRPALAALAVTSLAVIVLRNVKVQSPPTATQSSAPPARPLIAVEKPAVTLPASLLAVRGERSTQEFLKDLRPALDAYRADKFQEAAQEFEALSRKYPQSREVNFYLGVSRLLLHQAPGAVEPLLTARRLEGAQRSPQTSWYLALAYQQIKADDQFLSEMRALCHGTSEFASRACAVSGK